MKSIHIDSAGARPDFRAASRLATQAAQENSMLQPAIMSWHRHSNDSMAPYYEGANPDSWWEKFGEGNGGRLEVTVDDEYDFVLMDTDGYETLGEMPLRNLTDRAGTPYLCYTPMLGRVSSIPTEEACVELDGWLADQF